MKDELLPISVVIPTINRLLPLQKTLSTLAEQDLQPIEIIIIDASNNNETKLLCEQGIPGLKSCIIYHVAIEKGAATQRNQAVSLSEQPFILFMDDDVYLEKKCISKLWNCIQSDKKIGGVSALITNQQYHPPGKLTRLLLRIFEDKSLSYAGRCIGPAWNFLPEDQDILPEFVPVDWLNLGCTLYRKEAMPSPVFQSHFIGYSRMEDLTLSLTIGKKWKLFNARTAKIFHDTQPGIHKNNLRELEKMELINRHFVMTKVMNNTTFRDYINLFLLEFFYFLSTLKTIKGCMQIPKYLLGKTEAFFILIKKA